jgi:hypothetical protein
MALVYYKGKKTKCIDNIAGANTVQKNDPR